MILQSSMLTTMPWRFPQQRVTKEVLINNNIKLCIVIVAGIFLL